MLVASFLALAVLWTKPVFESARARAAARPAFAEPLAGAIGIAAFVAVVYAGFAGNQTATANLAPTTIYVIFWVGIPFAERALRRRVRGLQPVARVRPRVRAGCRRASRGSSLPAPMAYPARAGRWPAALGILAFAWVELVYVDRSDPSTLAILALVYAAIMLDRDVALRRRRVDVATPTRSRVVFGLYASMAPLHWRARRLYLRAPAAAALPQLMPMVAGRWRCCA